MRIRRCTGIFDLFRDSTRSNLNNMRSAPVFSTFIVFLLLLFTLGHIRTAAAVKNYNTSRPQCSSCYAPPQPEPSVQDNICDDIHLAKLFPWACNDNVTEESPVLNPGTQVAGVSIEIGPNTIMQNTYNGNLYLRHEVVSRSGKLGPWIAFSLNYNSKSRLDPSGEYGWGFQSYTGLRYAEDSGGNVIIRMEDGGVVNFAKAGPLFTSPKGVTATLEASASGYLLTMKYGTEYYFEDPSHRRVTRIVDTNGNTLTYSYNLNGLPDSVTDAAGRVMTLTYNSNSQLSEITDPNGKKTLLAYDAGHDLLRVTDPMGMSVTYSYDSDHRLLAVTDNSSGESVSITYDTFNGFGEGVKSITSNGQTWTFRYDAGAKVHSVTDPQGNMTKYYYDSYTDGRITRIEDHMGNATTYAWNSDNRIVSVTDNNGVTTNFTVDSKGNVLTATEAVGEAEERETTITYDPDHNRITSSVDAQGRTTTYDRDSRGNLTGRTEADGRPSAKRTQYGRGPRGEVVSRTEAPGKPEEKVTNYTQDAEGNVTSKTESPGKPEERTTTYTYDNNGDILSETEASGKAEERTTAYTYDEKRRIIVKKKALGKPEEAATSFTYDSRDNITTETDERGNTVSGSYQTIGDKSRLTSKTNQLGRTTTYQYDLKGNLTAETDPKGNTTTHSYDSLDRRTGRTDQLGRTTTYQYDQKGNLTAETDPKGNTTTHSYDSLDRLISSIDPLGNSTAHAYDSADRLISSTDKKGKVTTYTYDDLNRMTGITEDPGGLNIMTTYEYDNLGRRTGITNPKGVTTVYLYDSHGRITGMVEDPVGLNQTTTYEYDTLGHITRITDPLGKDTVMTYDALSRVKTVTNPESETTAYTYDPAGNRKTAALPNGNVVTYTYDPGNRITHVSDTLGTLNSIIYDENSNVLSHTDGNGNTTNRTYDVLNRPDTVTDPMGLISITTYDENSNPVTVTDRNGNTTISSYDQMDRAITVTDALGSITTYAYNSDGKIASVMDARGMTTSYQYDNLNRLVRETFADGNTREYTHDSLGNIVSRKDNNGAITTYTYDRLKRLTLINYPGANDSSFTYDTAGRLVTASNNDANIIFTYDDAGRVLSETLNGKTTSYIYDTLSGKTTITYPGGRVIEENTDMRGFLDTVVDVSIPTTPIIIATYTYDGGDRVTRREYDLGFPYSSYTYDTNDRITNLTNAPGDMPNFNYAYDNEGNRVYAEHSPVASGSEHYTYDAINRLVRYKKGTLSGSDIPSPDTQTQYNYDAAGNRTSTDTDGAVTAYTANSMNEYISISDGVPPPGTPVYDCNGNLRDDGTFVYAYDYENRMTAVYTGAAVSGTCSDATTGGTLVASYGYDPLGRRIQKDTGGATENYYYDGLRVIEERNSSDSVLATYVYGPGIDEVLTMDRSASTFYYFYNSLGSVVFLYQKHGTLEKYEYDAYGNVTVNGSVPSSAIGNPYMFTGRRLDPETGLYYYRARHYAPLYGRFMQRDPLGYVDGMNLYEYAGSNPVNGVDSFGCVSGNTCTNICNSCSSCLSKDNPIHNKEAWHRYCQGLCKSCRDCKNGGSVNDSSKLNTISCTQCHSSGTSADNAGQVSSNGEPVEGVEVMRTEKPADYHPGVKNYNTSRSNTSNCVQCHGGGAGNDASGIKNYNTSRSNTSSYSALGGLPLRDITPPVRNYNTSRSNTSQYNGTIGFPVKDDYPSAYGKIRSLNKPGEKGYREDTQQYFH